MGSIVFDFLTESFLFDQKSIINDYQDISDNQLAKELELYRNFILNKIDQIREEVILNNSTLKVFSSMEKIPLNTLKSAALYLDQFVLDDPIFALSEKSGKNSEVMGSFLGYQSSENVDRTRISKAALTMKDLAPMVAADYIKFLPISLLTKPPKETPIYYDPNNFESSLPQNIMELVKKNAVVKSMIKMDNGGFMICNKLDYTPAIFVGFGDQYMDNGMMFHYMFQKFEKMEENKLTMSMIPAEYPVSSKEWNIWANQSINRTAINLGKKVFSEISYASQLKSTYLTDDPFTANFIEQSYGNEETPQTVTANNLLNMELPILNKISVEKLMAVRQHEEEIFTNFRIELERQLRELRFINDPKELNAKRQNIMHELGEVGVQKINTRLSSLKKKALIDGAIGVGGLIASSVTGGWSLLSLGITGFGAYKTYNEYVDTLKENPSFMLWKVLDRKR